MTPSQSCVDLVKRFEGYAKVLPNGDCEAYPDPATDGDPITIGYGSTGPDIHLGLVWTRQQAEDRLASDLAKFSAGVSDLLGKAQTTQHQFDALVSFAYNVGLRNLKTSTLLRMHMAREYDNAANEFQKWTRAGGKIMAGLITRRSAEATLYRTPDGG